MRILDEKKKVHVSAIDTATCYLNLSQTEHLSQVFDKRSTNEELYNEQRAHELKVLRSLMENEEFLAQNQDEESGDKKTVDENIRRVKKAFNNFLNAVRNEILN